MIDFQVIGWLISFYAQETQKAYFFIKNKWIQGKKFAFLLPMG